MRHEEQYTVLIVDDMESNRYAIARILHQNGYKAIEASSGRECLDLVRRERPALIILDVKLPDMNGFEICARLKEEPKTARIPVLHISANFVASEDRVRGLESGADGYLLQPIRPDELVATVHALLRIREMEEEAFHLAEHWQKTFDAINDGVGLLDSDGIFIRCNQALPRVLAMDRSRILGCNCDEVMDGLMGHNRYHAFLEMRRSLKREAAEHPVGERWLGITCDPLLSEEGELAGAIYIVSDVTSRKQAEMKLVEQSRTLAQVNEALADANRRKDEFLAMLAHELRNPLAPIRYAAQMLRLTGPGQDHLNRQRDVIERQVAHMARLLDDLLDVTRITRGKIQLRKERLDLRQVAEQVLETVRAAAQERRLGVELKTATEPLWVDGDPTRVEQILRNLIANAIKYTEPGGRLGMILEQETGTMGSVAPQAVVRVWDTGIGIAPDVLPRVFDLFTQADQSLDRSQGGLGIGLTMVQRLVRMHGGTVEARSAGLGRGSEFVVRLPLLDASAEAEQGRALPVITGKTLPSASKAEDSRRVLIVEDNADSADTLADLLTLWGCQVRTVYDGAHALESARQFQPEVILLDIGLPGMSGYEVARQVRGEPALAGTLLVALTGYGQEEDRRQTQENGFDCHFTKPVDLNELRKVMAKAC